MKIQTLIQKLLAAGFKQADISRETGIPQARLSRWTNGMEPESAGDALLISELAIKVLRAKKRRGVLMADPDIPRGHVGRKRK